MHGANNKGKLECTLCAWCKQQGKTEVYAMYSVNSAQLVCMVQTRENCSEPYVQCELSAARVLGANNKRKLECTLCIA